MDAQELLRIIQESPSPLVAPRPLAHSFELKEGLPLVRRHVGPRPWYEALEAPEKR